MDDREIDALIGEAERLRGEYVDAVDRDDLETALRIGAVELVPVSERLADADARYYDPLGLTLMNLSAVCHHLQLPITGFYFVQRALQVATLLDIKNLPINDALVDIGFRTETFATAVTEGQRSREDMPDPEQQMVVPAASLVPRSIDLMRRLDGYHAACQLRVAATRLRTLANGADLDVVDHESKSMVWLARFAHSWNDPEFALAEVGAALRLWLGRLDQGARFWSTGLLETWTVAADLLESLSRQESAMALRGAIEQAAATPTPAVLDLREHYRAALAGLRPRG